MKPISHTIDDTRFSKTPKLKVKLPIPDPDVMGMTEDEAVRMRYLESIERIAKLESETLLKVQEMSDKYKIKIALILAGVVAIGGAVLFKVKFEGRCGDKVVTIEPQKVEINK